MTSRPKKAAKASAAAPRPPTHPLPTNPAELEHVLSLLLAPDNAAIARATTIMNDFLKQPASIPALLQQITESTSVQARQMAAVLLRRKIRPLWSSTPADVKTALKAALLQRLTAEPVRVVRRSVAALIAKIAEETVPKQKWPELLDFLFHMTRSHTVDHREMGMLLFRALSENIPKALQAHAAVLQGIFVAGLSDAEDRVRIEALHALDALVEMVDPESDEQVMAFSSAIPPLVQLVSTYLSASHHEHDSEVVSVVFELFDSLTASPAPVLDPHLHLIVPMMMTVMRTQTFEMNIRDQAAVFLQTVVKEKPKKITKQNHVLPLLQAVVPLLCDDDDHSSEEVSAQHMGADLLDTVLLNIPRKHTFDWTMSTVSMLLASSKPGEVKGGLVVLSVAAESYCDLLAPHFDALIKAVVRMTSHNSRFVRTAAWIALNQFSVHCSHLTAEYKQLILPALLRALAATGESHQVTEKACFALETLADQLEKDDITPYLHELMSLMLTLLNQPGVDEDTVRSCLMTIKTLADIVKTAFVPYFPPLLPILSTLLASSADEHLNLRCRATECVGYLAEAVGKDVFAPHLQPVLQRVMEGMKLDYFELRESSYVFFSKLAIMLQDDFAPLLSTVLTLVLATCTSDDGIDASWKAGGFDDEDGPEGEEDEEDELPRHRRNGEDEYGSELEEDLVEDEEEDVLRTVNFSVRSGALDEKVAALECMSFIFTTQTAALQPYIERCSIVLDELSGFLHPRVREASSVALFDMVQWHHRVYPIDPPVKGQMLTLPAEHAKVLKLVMEPSVRRLSEEEDRDAARSLLEIIETCIRLYGFTAVNECPKELSKQLQLLLKEKAFCVAEGTFVASPEGVSSPIQSFSDDRPTSVVSYDERLDGCVIRKTEGRYLLRQGVQECVELVLEDGRALVCTPDHRIRTRRGDVEVRHLLPTDRVIAAVDGPAVEDELEDWALEYDVVDRGVTTHVRLSMLDDDGYHRCLAFARVLGYLVTDGSLFTADNRGTLYMGHRLDAESIRRDVAAVLGCAVTDIRIGQPRPPHSNTFDVTVPARLARVMERFGCPVGKKLGQGVGLPAIVTQTDTPKPFLREFLGAMFGGDGCAPLLLNPTANGVWQSVRFVTSVMRAERDGAVALFEDELIPLLSCFGVLDGAVSVRPCTAPLSSPDTWQITLRCSSASLLPFASNIGFRHCVHKQVRLSVACSWYRAVQTRTAQRLQLVDAVRQQLAAAPAPTRNFRRPAITMADALQAAYGALAESAVPLDGALPSAAQMFQYQTQGVDPATLKSIFASPWQFVRSVGATDFFNEGEATTGSSAHVYAVPRHLTAMPVWDLGIAGVRAVGARQTYDLTVADTHLFVANGMVVHNCQRPSDDQSDDTDLSDHDLAIDSTTEVLSALALTGGPLYLPMLKEHAPLLFKFTNKDREPTSRAMAIGALAEIAKEVGSDGMAPYLGKLVPLAVKSMEDISIEVRRNATYCVAVLITACGQSMVQHYPTITRSVEKLMQVPAAGMYTRDAANGSSHHQHRADSKEERKEEKRLEAEERVSEEDFLGCRDNAASVIVRMLNAAASLNLIATLPHQSLFTTLFNALPLQIDQQEARSVYGGLIALYQHHSALIAPWTPQVLTAFAAVFGHPDVDASVQHDMVAFCGALMHNNRGSVERVVQAMPEKNRQQFVRFVVEQQQIGKESGAAVVNGSRTVTVNGNGHLH